MTAAEPDTVDDYLETLDEGEERDAAEALVALVRENAPELDETFKWNQPTWERDGEHVCYVKAYGDHVNLGFFRGAELPDPGGLLEGTGKRLRHVKVPDPGTVRARRAALSALIRAAVEGRTAGGAGGVDG